MSHPFGDLLGQFLHRKHGLSQFKLADGIDQPPSVISEMCQGKRLTGGQTRIRVVDILQWLKQHEAVFDLAEANQLLNAAGLTPLNPHNEIEAGLLQQLSQEGKPFARARTSLSGSDGHRRHNLPVQFTRFIGRSDQIPKLAELITTRRLVTLTGAGGVGKTRLALEVAAQVLDAFKDGAWLIDLAPLSDPALLPQTLLQALQAPEQPAQSPVKSLITFLGAKRQLLILDNCEHLLVGIAQLADQLLRATPQVSLLATSREAVHIPAELAWQVPSLTRPPVHFEMQHSSENAAQPSQRFTGGFDPGQLEQYEAVKLFIDRLQNREPTFQLKAENSWAVAHICSRLDGIPLALEMAAAWISVLTLEEIAARLSGAIDERFHLLGNSSRTVSHRQQTLQATMEWSYDLLTSSEQQLLVRLPVFMGSWTADAAEKICADNEPGGIARTEVLPLLFGLIEKSLVIADRQNGQTRYRMLETVRQFALKKIACEKQIVYQDTKPVDFDGMRDRHLVYYVEWVGRAEQNLSQDQSFWLYHLEREHENIRTAMNWGLSNERCAEQTLQLAITSEWYFRLRGDISEGRSCLSGALSHFQSSRGVSSKKTTLQALGLNRLARMASLQGDFPVMYRLIEESISIWLSLSLEHCAGYAEALMILGDFRTVEGDFTAANALYGESLHIYRQLKDTQGICSALTLLGWSAMRVGNYPEAEKFLEEFKVLARKMGYAHSFAFAMNGLGELALRQGQHERANVLLEESLALLRVLGDQWSIGNVLGTLGWSAQRQGDYQQMRVLLKESAAIRLEIGDKGGLAWCLEKLAGGIFVEAHARSTSKLKDYQRAVCLYGAAAAIRAPLQSGIDPVDRPEYEQNIAGLREQLTPEDFAKAWDEGEQQFAQDQSLVKVLELGLKERGSATSDTLRLREKMENQQN